jgi:hypothetical protein
MISNQDLIVEKLILNKTIRSRSLNTFRYCLSRYTLFALLKYGNNYKLLWSLITKAFPSFRIGKCLIFSLLLLSVSCLQWRLVRVGKVGTAYPDFAKDKFIQVKIY